MELKELIKDLENHLFVEGMSKLPLQVRAPELDGPMTTIWPRLEGKDRARVLNFILHEILGEES